MSQDSKISTIQPLRPFHAPTHAAASTGDQQRLRRVFIRDLMASCSLGIHAHEKQSPQRVCINIDVAVLDDGPPPADEIVHVGCYEDIAHGIRAILGGPHINLVETLAEKIAGFCLEDDRAVSALVRVEKLDVFEDATSAGVEIERFRKTD